MKLKLLSESGLYGDRLKPRELCLLFFAVCLMAL